MTNSTTILQIWTEQISNQAPFAVNKTISLRRNLENLKCVIFKGCHHNILAHSVFRIFFFFTFIFFYYCYYFFFPLGKFDDVVFVADSFYRAISFSTLTSDDTLISDLALENLTSPQGIDFDPYAENIYWADNFRGEVQRSSIYGKDQTVIRSDLAQPEALALDLVARNVYWINVGNMTIQVSDLNGKYSKVVG